MIYRKGKKYMGKEYINGKIKSMIEYKNYKKWNVIEYDENDNILYKLINGNGIIKEYNSKTGTIEFEGEYLNGERNGKGKEFDQYGNLIFEGEYLNGERNGIGKEFYPNGALLSEAEYFHGQKNGKGIEYNEYNSLIFDGV